MLQHVVHLATALEHGAGEAAQEVALVAVQAPGKATRQHRFQRGIELGALLGVIEQTPEGLEAAPCITLADHVHAFEQLRQHVAALAFIVDDAFAELAVELLEVIAHAPEILGQLVGQADDLARTFQGALAIQRGDAAGADAGDLGVDAVALVAQRREAGIGVGLGLRGQLRELFDDQCQAALGGATRACSRPSAKRIACSAAVDSSYCSWSAPSGRRRSNQPWASQCAM